MAKVLSSSLVLGNRYTKYSGTIDKYIGNMLSIYQDVSYWLDVRVIGPAEIRLVSSEESNCSVDL